MEFSNLMLGTVQFGMNYGIANQTGKPLQSQVNEMISFAWGNGVNCLDTASIYGESELVIGTALEDIGLRHQIKIISKVAHFSTDLPLAEVKDHIYKSVFNSLERLKVDYLDVCLLHNEKYFYAIELLAELKERGLVKSIGLSFSGVNFNDATKVLLSSLVDVLQVPGSALDRRFESSSPSGFVLAKERSIPIFVRSVYLQGLLLLDTAPPSLEAVQPALDAIGELARRYDLSREALCVRYMLGINRVSSLLMGVETLEQLKENLLLIKQGPLPPSVHQEISQTLPLLPANLLCPALWSKG